MRVRIVFLLKNKGSLVPFYHQSLLAQMTEDLLADSEYARRTDFTFSGLKGQTKVSKNGLHFFSSRITLVFSAADTDMLDFMIQRLFEQKELEVGGLQLIPESVEQEFLPEFTESIKCVCISPIVPIDPASNEIYAKKFIPPDTDVFSDFLYESTMTRMERSGAYTAEQIASFYKFQIIPDKTYLQKIREGEKKFARIYPVTENGNKYEIRGYTFPFTLYCAPEVQNFLFTCGLGFFSHKGFGMLDITNADAIRKTESYLINETRQVG